MPIFNVQRSRLRLFLELWGSALAGILGILLVSGTIPLGVEDEAPLRGSARQGAVPAGLKADRLGEGPVRDTTRPDPIAVKPCSVHATYRNREKTFLPYEPIRDDVIPSLHEFTCRWAVGNDLSIDSTRLPKYVRPVGDSIRLSTDALTYPVKMVQLREEPNPYPSVLYFVAEIGDSLYYREIEEAHPKHVDPSTVAVRSHRLLDVPEADAKYIWFEYAKSLNSDDSGTPRSIEEWKAHVFSYDQTRGMRHLAFTAIRREVRKNGKLHGARQLDVSIPRAGVMDVEERLQKGAKVTRGMAWDRFLGRHVIDTTAVSPPPPPPPPE